MNDLTELNQVLNDNNTTMKNGKLLKRKLNTLINDKKKFKI